MHCGIAMKHDEWTQLKDTELQKEFGVYVKWNKCAMGKCVTTDNTGVKFARFDQWKIHVADVENCEYWISTEGERFITDDNANPPVCYNYGKCMPITTDATTVAEAQRRPQLVAPGLVSYDASSLRSPPSRIPTTATATRDSPSTSRRAISFVSSSIPRTTPRGRIFASRASCRTPCSSPIFRRMSSARARRR